MNFYTIPIVTLLALFVNLSTVFSQAQWTQTSNGIEGGQVTSMAAINETIFAGTVGGVFRSTDNAVTWVSMNNGLKGTLVNSLLSVGNTLYVATNDTRTYFSTDLGSSWQLINLSVTLVKLVVLESVVYGLSNNGVLYRLVSSNNSALVVTTGLSNISSLAVSDTKLFLGTYSDGLYSSTDAVSWTKVSMGQVNSVASLDAYGSTIIAEIDSKLYLSKDGGANWSNTGLKPIYRNIGLINDNIIIGSMDVASISSDGGTNWSKIIDLPGMVGFVKNSTGYYVGSNNGVYRTDNSAEEWSFSSKGLLANSVSALTSLNKKIFASSFNHIYSSSDWGTTWQLLNADIPSGVFSLATIGNNLLAGTYSDGIYLSVDVGTSWKRVDNTIGASCFVQLNGSIYAGNYQGVFVSKDNGQTWTIFASVGYVNALGVTGNDLYVAGVKLIRFSDVGKDNQTQKELAFPNPISSFASISNQIFCGTTNGGIYTSTNGGENWSPVNNGIENSFIVKSLFSFEDYLYASRMGEGIYYSANRGASWSSYNKGFPESVTNQFNYMPALMVVEGRLFAGTTSAGIWSTCPFLTAPIITATDINTASPVLTSSESNGNHWYLNGKAIANATDKSITVSESGVYHVEIPTLAGCARKSADFSLVITDVKSSVESELVKLYPVPSNSAVTIDLVDLPESQQVVMHIIDVIGNSLGKLSGHGGQSLQLNISEYAPGIYYLQTHTSERSTVVRFIKQ